MTQYLTDIFNHSLTAGYFPDIYKEATMTLIPKPGTAGTAVKDKRPISLLNIDGKLFNKILDRRLTTHLEDNNLQNDRQHGFRKNRGTQTALLTLYETISKHLGQRHKVDIVCRDVTKAFDKMWHTGLKYKLTELGLHDCYRRILWYENKLTRYENKWKIQTNMHKFQTLNIARRTTHPIITDEQIISYTNKATVLGLTFSTRSITPQITTRRAMAMKTLKRLQRFRNLSTNNKRRLYKTIIRPQLLYPIIPLNTISHSSYRKLQQVQNKALRFIESTKLTDRIPSTTLHTRNELPAINTYIHTRAIDA